MPINRLIPVNLRLPEDLIGQSDHLAKQEGSNRSQLVRAALRSYIERRQKLHDVFAIVERRGSEAGVNSSKDIDDALAQTKSNLRES